jgi:hypothetical protein
MIGPLRALIRTALPAVLAVALVALPAVPVSADASKSVNLACTITLTLDINPGLTPEVHHFTSVTRGLTGTANCTGTVNGQQVTGPGSFQTSGQAVGSCTSFSGKGNFVLRVPTAAGVQTIPGHLAFSGSPTTPVIITGDLTGTSKVISAVGDCFTTPTTQLTVVDTVKVT